MVAVEPEYPSTGYCPACYRSMPAERLRVHLVYIGLRVYRLVACDKHGVAEAAFPPIVSPLDVASGPTETGPIEGVLRTTRGIAPAQEGPLHVLQQTPPGFDQPPFAGAIDLKDAGTYRRVREAALDLAGYHPPTDEQAARYTALSGALADFLQRIVNLAPPGPERSTAISRAREAKGWAASAIALEPQK